MCLVAAALLAPTPASATRTVPGLERPGLGPPPPALDELLEASTVTEQADRLPLYTTVDVVTLGGASSLEADQVEAVVARQRYRLHLLSGQLARSDELAWGPKTATGLSTSLVADKHLKWRQLEPKPHRRSYQGLWTDPTTGLAYARNRWYDARSASWLSEDPIGAVDSPNLYAFVGWGPQAGTDPMGLSVAQMLAEEEYENELAFLESMSPEEREEYLAGKEKGHRLAASVLVGLVPGLGEIHDYSQLATGRDYIAGEPLSDSDRIWVAGALATPVVGGRVTRWLGDTRAGTWLGRKAGEATEWTFRKGVVAVEGMATWWKQRRQLKAAQRLGVLGADSVVAGDLVKELAEASTYGSGDRMVIGRWLKDDPGSFERIAQAEGGVFYNLPAEAYEALGDTPSKRKALADAVNEQVFRNQMERGVSRIVFVTGETYEEVLMDAVGSARRNEVMFLQENAAEFGYVLDEDNFAWIRAAGE